MRKRADDHLRENIRVLSLYECNEHGEVTPIRNAYWLHRYLGFRLAQFYYITVRKFGWFAANGTITQNKE